MPGGGTTYLRALEALENFKVRGDAEFGVEVVRAALEEPLRWIAENGGLDGGEVIAEVSERKGRVGFDARSGSYKDLLKAGIIDPAKVTITSLQNALSAAVLNLTTEVLITEIEKKNAPVLGAES